MALSNFDENEWVARISRCLEEELVEEHEIPVAIFNVPKVLRASNPHCYLPQQLAIGPYHYFTPEHYEMERFKIAAARRVQNEQKNLKFHNVVDHFKCSDLRIRAYYHKYLNLSDDTLAWIVAVDAAFLLEFLRIYAEKVGKVATRFSSSMSHFLDCTGTKSAHNILLRDIVLLENQIPLFLLRKVLEFQFSSLDYADDLLFSMLIGFCEEISPFHDMEERPKIQALSKRAHLLDFLYHTIVPKFEESYEIIEVETDDQEQEKAKEGGESPPTFLQKVKIILIAKPCEIVLKLQWKFISNLPGIRLIKEPIENMFFPANDNEGFKAGNTSKKIKLVEEIEIPSVTELSKAGVSFVPTYTGISSIKFDVKKKKFYLPKVYLDVNSEVILRNLVAYESCIASEHLAFTRYTELMNGIVDDQEDAKLLREKGIIVNQMKSDKEVADLWNGMSRSIKVTRVENLDKAIEDVNKYYNGRWSTKAKNFMKDYVFGSWKCLTILAALFLLFLMTLQAFCSIYNCPRSLGHLNNMD